MTNQTLQLKACNRCGGDLIPEELLGDVDLVCLQCGHRSAAPYAPSNPYSLPMSMPVEIGKLRKRMTRKAA
ncbi:MAG: hypothetical protein ABI559_01470 [Chloroflexota bacterium]